MHEAHELGSHVVLVLPLVGALVAYWVAAGASRRRGAWPRGRLLSWSLGILVCAVAVVGPLADLAESSFVAHMVAHILLGMLGPLLLVLSAPITLALRVLPVKLARRLVPLLASPPVRFLTHPLTAAVLCAGGLWALYTTSLYALTQTEPLVHGLVHVHVLLSGYLLTAALVGVDPDRHRRSLTCRMFVLLAFLAFHGVLAKLIYAQPPQGVSAGAAEVGAMVMYYGGDVVDVLLLVVLFARWYRVTAPRAVRPSLSDG